MNKENFSAADYKALLLPYTLLDSRHRSAIEMAWEAIDMIDRISETPGQTASKKLLSFCGRI